MASIPFARVLVRANRHYRSMNRDPTYFPDFDEFRPERYLDSTGQLMESIPDTHGHGHFSFGGGRR